MKRRGLIAIVLAASVLGSACTGYRVMDTKPVALAGVNTVSVPMFTNGTLHPRAEALATSAVADALVRDGTFRLVATGEADAVLEGKLSSITYSTIRGSRLDTLLPEELANTAVIDWKLIDARNPTKVLASGRSEGRSQLFVSSNLQTARNNSLPEALERAAEQLVSRMATGF